MSLSAVMKLSRNPMRSLLALPSALLLLLLCDPGPSYDQAFQLPSDDELPVLQHRDPRFRPVLERDETRPAPPKDTLRETDYRPAREIKQFAEPTLLLRGTAEEIGLDSHTLDSFLETKFLQSFAFLQDDFTFDKKYETWEIGLFECEAWTVGSNYPIAFHVQCAGGSMDEPRHWHVATLGYGPKDKIVEAVRKALDSIVTEYATFVRKARGRE